MIDLFAENRNHGFARVPSTCPTRFKNRIVEIRSAILGGRSIPEPTAEYREQAQAALRFANKLFRTPPADEPNLEELSARLLQQAEVIRVDEKRQRDSEREAELREETRRQNERDAADVRRSIFPWERN
jgi:hypothetical protein